VAPIVLVRERGNQWFQKPGPSLRASAARSSTVAHAVPARNPAKTHAAAPSTMGATPSPPACGAITIGGFSAPHVHSGPWGVLIESERRHE
jgi:hypothetical protein